MRNPFEKFVNKVGADIFVVYKKNFLIFKLKKFKTKKHFSQKCFDFEHSSATNVFNLKTTYYYSQRYVTI